MITYTCTVYTPLGAMTAAACGQALTGLWFTGQKYYPEAVSGWTVDPAYPVFNALRPALAAYFEGRNIPSGKLLLQLAPQGTPFQKLVWDILLQIPFGQTTTYGEIASSIALSRGAMSAQAVGGAVGRNPISILIPCHRVVGANQNLTGYAGGLDKKAALLRLEQIARQTSIIPRQNQPGETE